MDITGYNIYLIVKKFLGDNFLDATFSGDHTRDINDRPLKSYRLATFYIHRDTPNVDIKNLLDLMTGIIGPCLEQHPENIMSGDHIALSFRYQSILEQWYKLR